MELIGLDKDFCVVAYIPYLNLQWRRRYYRYGEFSLQIVAKDYSKEIRYIYSQSRPELGMVEKIEFTRTASGDFVQMSGAFFEKILDNHYTYPPIKEKLTLKAMADKVLTHEWYKPLSHTIAVSSTVPTDISVDIDWQSKKIGESLYSTLKPLEMGWRIRYNADNDALAFETWQGLDRTQEQRENEWALFADDSVNTVSFSYTQDESQYKNHALIFYGRQSSGYPYRYDYSLTHDPYEGRRMLLLNMDDDLTTEQRIEKAKEELAKYKVSLNAKIEVMQVGYLYLTDYDLGDKVNVACHTLGHAFSSRIEEVDEIFKNGTHTVKLVIGELEKTVYQQVARYADSAILAKHTPIVTIP